MARPRRPPDRRLILWTAALLATGWAPGCRIPTGESTQDARIETIEDEGRITDAQLRHKVMRFADNFGNSMADAIETQLLESASIEDQLELYEFRLFVIGVQVDIASGPDAEINLLDMIVHVTLLRIELEQGRGMADRIPVEGLLAQARLGEEQIWAVAQDVMSEEDLEKLRALVEGWAEMNPDRTFLEGTRFLQFVVELDETESPLGALSAAARGILVDLDDVVTESEQVRVIADRSLYLAHRAPFLARFQVQVALLEFLNQPQVRAMQEGYLSMAESMRSLPETFAEEREAGLAQLFEGLAAEREALGNDLSELTPEAREVVAELKATLEAGTALLASANVLATRFESEPGAANEGRPFDIREYNETASSVAEAGERLERAIIALDRLLAEQETDDPTSTSALGKASLQGQALIDHAYRAGVRLVLWILAGVMAILLLFRYLVPRFARVQAPGGES